jgi:acyl-CoA synthetase (NDP forming)
MLDSGGEREMLVDLADAAGTPLARLSDSTLAALRARLHHSLEAVNPLDAWGTADNYEEDFEEYMVTMAADPDAAMTLFCGDLTWSPNVQEGYPKVMVQATKRTEKPVAALINMPTSGFMEVGLAMSEAGVAVLSGTKSGLTAIRHAMAWRDRKGADHDAGLPTIAAEVTARWQARLDATAVPDETELLTMLADFGIEIASAIDDDGGEVPALHLAMTRDAQFGPIAHIGSGGAIARFANDTCHLMPPFGPAVARGVLDRLALRPLFEAWSDDELDAFARSLPRFSLLCAALGDCLEELDVDLAVVGPGRGVARQARAVSRQKT